MKKNLLIPIILLIVLFLGLAVFFILKNRNANNQPPEIIQTPPEVKKVNTLPLAQRPFVELIPHANPARCGGVDMRITNLKNNETKTEYELEYNTTTMIQGVFGNREFNSETEHAPLEFGTCSAGKCKCDDKDIVSGNLKLMFHGGQEYTLKEDFAYFQIEAETKISSLDKRLTLDLASVFPAKTNVIVANTFGLPSNLTAKVIKGPYGIFIEGVKIGDQLESSVDYTLQASEIGRIQVWDGSTWQIVESTYADGKYTFSFDKLVVIVLTE